MSAHEHPSGPAFTKVQLTGPPEAVSRLMEALGRAGELIFGPVTAEPDARGDVSSTARMVTHPRDQAPTASRVRLVTVQTALEVDAEARPGLEESVVRSLENLPGVLQASSRVIADVSLPDPRD
ncbi:hypothetical protein [Streptomyces lydicus]|uniref:hypothetical protein n=1 Tax=Streptomyces lydicus TaxID=47763 RepID=UPI00101299B0|nr:hypothetical protein [Streptomyces lydicus]MCZ1011953.1 hypothetical protein [Streptomyces lydicus]